MENNTLLPQEFIEKMATILPESLSLQEFVDSCHQPLRRSIRVNTLKISITDFINRAAEHGWILSPIPWCETGFWISIENETSPLGNSFEHLAGLFYIQEASSMMPVSALFHYFQADEDKTLLDAAAAPGSKTTQIAAKMDNKGLIIANEFSSSRIKMLHANIQRCGIKNVALTHFDAKVFGTWLPDSFDAILLDSPCSGEGTIRKDKLAMKNWSQIAIEDIASMQQGLIESAFQALKVDGVLIYSTCTLSLEENQNICTHLQTKYPDSVEFLSLGSLYEGAEKVITAEGFLHIWPQVYDSEGFFVAAIRKIAKVEVSHAKKRLGKIPFIRPTRQKEAQLYSYFSKQFGIENIDGMLYQRDKEFWLFPDNIKPFINEIRFSRLGIKIAEEFGNLRKVGFKTQHEFVTTFGQLATKNIIELTAQQAQSFYQGVDIRDINTSKATGEALASYRGVIIGLGKGLNNRFKNNLPRELIRDNNLFEQ
ncbi:16S rRNA (cytosine(1407)-C(5))-methyltransferase RsmF [Psychromonas sp. psych-6C06]|uniref:16S rRNA (cytosine(1407)-C(5))-methyltransferase RsmF n=1 Tax=Psychromonas sp. psych-6C06 TaxID=2058089 RepID=UPI000C33008C|nr:16S rRNA (cytosine(1407)-C(5))-methyltransferase RsmF [Psychromonas sp. psych-6C06]PKF61145.1 16S rRNA (cytosine(1407)-C(5))-methyltransferase RsmF [Psychromonas sp. psych-6C06]